MKKDDYGFYGKGIDGYVHYKQAFDEMHKSPASHSSHRINPRHSYTSGDFWDTLFTIIGGVFMIGGRTCIDHLFSLSCVLRVIPRLKA